MIVLEVSVVMVLATVVRSVFGFGEALIAVPILAAIIPVELAAPVAVFASIIVAGVAVSLDWRHVHFRSAARLIFSTLFGIPVGLLILKTMPEFVVKGMLGAIIFFYSLYSMTNRRSWELSDDRFAWFFGFLAGIFGGAYGINGPPLAIYGSLRNWSPARFRATLQGYFLPASIFGMIGFGVAGLWTHTMLRLSLWSLPSIAIGIPIGRWINHQLEPRRFVNILNVGLGAIGILLLAQSCLVVLGFQK